METLYSDVPNYKPDGTFSHYEVVPIRVVRRGISPGCTAESITAIWPDGRKFNSSAQHYSVSEAAAWDKIRAQLAEAIARRKEQLFEQTKELNVWQDYLRTPN